jgi:hypothetical protein
VAHNRRLLQNLLRWLLSEAELGLEASEPQPEPNWSPCWPSSPSNGRSCVRFKAGGTGETTVAFVEQMLAQSGMFKALARPSWMP